MSNLAKNLEYLLFEKRLSANQLQEQSGITQSTTTRILNGKTPSDSDRTVILPKIELSARQSYDKIANILAQTLKADENG